MPRILRQVEKAVMYEGRGSILGPDTSRRVRWWELALSCGHRVERYVRYTPPADGHRRNGWHPAPASAALPAPSRAVCDACANRAAVRSWSEERELLCQNCEHRGKQHSAHGPCNRCECRGFEAVA